MSAAITGRRDSAPINTAMRPISPNKAGLVLGSLAGAWHLLWSSMVLVGWAQSVIDFIFWIHFIKPVYVIGPFNAGIALILVITTTLSDMASDSLLECCGMEFTRNIACPSSSNWAPHAEAGRGMDGQARRPFADGVMPVSPLVLVQAR
jgi:hypothetical protein